MATARTSIALNAGLTGISEENGVLSVGFGQGPDLDGWQFVISRTLDSDGDRAVSDNDYDITSGWQEGSVSGGIVSWASGGMRIAFSMETDAARELRLAKRVDITILDRSTDMRTLVAALTTVLGPRVPRVTLHDAVER